MILASFVAGLAGVPGRQVRYANPQTMEQDLQIALSIQEGEKQEEFNDNFYTRFNNSVRMRLQSSSRTRPEDCQPRHSDDATRAGSHTAGQHHKTPRRINKSTNLGTRNDQTQSCPQVLLA